MQYIFISASNLIFRGLEKNIVFISIWVVLARLEPENFTITNPHAVRIQFQFKEFKP